MEIYLPKTDTGGDEKDKDYWEAKALESSATQKEQIIAFGEFFSKLSKKTKEIDEELLDAKKTIEFSAEQARKTIKMSEDTRSLVVLGFVVLLLMIAGMVFNYWQFVYLESKEFNENILENKMQITKLEVELDALKKCFKSGMWKQCF